MKIAARSAASLPLAVLTTKSLTALSAITVTSAGIRWSAPMSGVAASEALGLAAGIDDGFDGSDLRVGRLHALQCNPD